MHERKEKKKKKFYEDWRLAEGGRLAYDSELLNKCLSFVGVNGRVGFFSDALGFVTSSRAAVRADRILLFPPSITRKIFFRKRSLCLEKNENQSGRNNHKGFC
jgi:hypothetical protein